MSFTIANLPGSGTQADPFPDLQNRRRLPARECKDPLHKPERGRWFHPAFTNTIRCPFCANERPCKSTLDKQRQQANRAAPSEDAKVIAVRVPQGVYNLFQAFHGKLQPLIEAAAKLETVRVQRDFGVYGRITCTEQELRLAQLDIATADSVEDNLYDLYLMLATGISVPEITQMRQSGGRQPRYPEMRAYYQQQETARGLQRDINETRKWLRETTKIDGRDVHVLEPKDIKTLKLKLFEAEQKIINTLPQPPKSAEVHFGEDDNVPAVQLAKKRVNQFMLTIPGTAEKPGGPGPVR